MIIVFMSEERARRLTGVTDDCAIISIVDSARMQPGTQLRPPPELAEWRHKLQMGFDDVNPVLDPSVYDDFSPMSDENARRIIEFVTNLPGHVKQLVVHCQAGISRSAAVAKFIATIVGAEFDHDYNGYNPYVYDTLSRAWDQKT